MAAQKRGVRTIPQEIIITEILYRIPAKSVGRFRCVSKDWLSLLTDPQFIKTHRNNNTLNNQPHLIFQSQPDEGLHSHPFHSGEKVVSTPTKFILESDLVAADDIFFSSSCDGLVLVIFWCEDCRGTLFLVNPTTRENLQLNYQFEASIYVENLNADFMYGFGYDIVTDDYKVVIISYFSYYAIDEEDGDEVEGVCVYVYSLRNKTWKRVIDPPPYHIHSEINGVFVNGFIHWIVSTGHSQVGDDDLLVIAAFSLADESFSEVPSPKLCDITKMFESYYSQLVVLGGKLAIFLPKKNEIWLMNEYGVRESWTKISLHGINNIPIFEPERYGNRPLVLEDNGKILVANNDRMVVYEVEKGTFNKTVCVWNPENFSAVGTYVESLVSLKPNIAKQKPTNSREGKENTHQERQTGKRKDIDSSSAPLNIVKLVFSSPQPRDLRRSS